MDIQKKEEIAEHILIVCEFKYVFPKELPGLAPEREIDFEIELIPSGQPISKAPYRIVPVELRELNIQLHELL